MRTSTMWPSTPTPMPKTPIPAGYPGKCPACGEEVRPGDPIVKDDDGEWVHMECDE
jgi:hypothetical protein